MRRSNPELMKNWKIPVRATVAGKVEMATMDPLTREPRYGARTKLIEGLLLHWLDTIQGKAPEERHPIPTLEELRSA